VPGLGRAGWISSGVKPGDLGRAVILGRRSQSGEDVFAKLGKAHAGDQIVVTTASGKTLTFVVRSVHQYATGQLPQSLIEGGSKQSAQLRLITSTGTYNQAKGGFPRNLVVFADLSSN
jgi:sortase (surface protein transpeptidase)